MSANGIVVWLDEAELILGDSLREKIDLGLNKSQFGVVILSKNFFKKHWPRSELDGLFARETISRKVLLPVWHDLTVEEVKNYSPILAGRFAVNTVDGLDKVVKKIMHAIRAAGRSRITGRPIFAGKLTKKTLMVLPVGSILISNVVNIDLTPHFVEELGTIETREDLWIRLRSAAIPGKKIYVFEDIANLRMHMASRHDWLEDNLREKFTTA